MIYNLITEPRKKSFMIRVFLLFISIVWTQFGWSHPGIGLVYDGEHSIYYTDLNHIWVLDTRTGEQRIAVENIHSHELCLDNEGQLYGEHYWYDNSGDLFKNYIWKLDQEGNLSTIREVQPGENVDFGFVRDSKFRSYSLRSEKGKSSVVLTDSIGSEVIYRDNFNKPGWFYLSPENTLYFTDYPTLYRLKDNSLRPLAKDLNDSRFPFSIQPEEHHLYGIWTDSSQNIFIAQYGGRAVKKIYPNGEIKRVYTSAFFWSPINGVFDKNQQLWLMESSLNGKTRLRKIDPSELRENKTFIVENIIMGSIPLSIVIFLVYRRKRKRSPGITTD